MTDGPAPLVRHSKRSWAAKFGDCVSGLRILSREQSFRTQLLIAAMVPVLAGLLRVSAVEWSILIVCTGVVLAAEALNTAIERLGRAVTDEQNDHVRAALDVAAAAVLIASIGAAATGAVVFLNRLL